MRERWILLFALLLAATGCKSSPDYSRQLADGESALRLVTDPADLPDIERAVAGRRAMMKALDESIVWFSKPSSQKAFPFEFVTHDRAHASVRAMREILERGGSNSQVAAEIVSRFDVYESVGCDDEGTVLFTGYYAGEFPASRSRTSRFTHPLYARPADLATDPQTGEPQGRRRSDGGLEPYPTRRQIEEGNLLAGSELVWLDNKLTAYLIHVNGSAKLRMEDGSIVYIGYNGKTDRPYGSLGKALVDAGILEKDGVSISTIRRAHEKNPKAVESHMYANESFVFFTEYDGSVWPAGSLGVKVTAEASLATDKQVYPRGGVVLAETMIATARGNQRPFLRFLCDQDTGGAIRAPGRADIFLGVGESVGAIAGEQKAEGKLYYFFLKDELVATALAE